MLSDLSNVIQSSINLIQHEEWSWLDAVDGEEERQGSDRLLGHGLEPLAGDNAVVVDPLQVGLLWVLRSQKCLNRSRCISIIQYQ